MPSSSKAEACNLALGLNLCVFEPADIELILRKVQFTNISELLIALKEL